MTRLRRCRQTAWFCIVIFVLALCAGTRAPTPQFAGGTGTPEDPYQIATPEQLWRIGDNRFADTRIGDYGSANKWFVLTADIDCSAMQEGLFPDWYSAFDGVLDGNFHVLRDLMIPPEAKVQTLFPILGSSGILRNLVVENCRVYTESNNDAVGLLCGTNEGQIRNCHMTGCVVSARGKGDVGILAGANQGLVEDCQAENVTVISLEGSLSGGGLVGRNLGMVRYCATAGSLFGSQNGGGLVGVNASIIEASCASVVVAAAEYSSQHAGGLVGINDGTVADCYATQPVWGSAGRAGLVGQHRSGEIIRCYSTGPVFPSYRNAATGGPSVTAGPLVGQGDAASVRQCYYLSANDAINPPNGLGTALSPSEMMRRENYKGWAFSQEDPASPWVMPENGFPRLVWEFHEDIPVVAGLDVPGARQVLEEHGWQVGEVRSDCSRQIVAGRVIWTFPSGRAMPGTLIDIMVSQGALDWSAVSADPNVGTPARPLKIRTAGQLEALRDLAEIENKHIELAANLDMAGRVFSEAPLGSISTMGRSTTGKGFAGNLQGNGFEISNLTIRTSPPVACPALVGHLTGSGRIMNLGLVRVTITSLTLYGSQSGGVLVGLNDGLVQGCYVRDFLCAGGKGGLVGWNNGTIEECFSTHGAVCAGESGGLVGFNAGTVDKCFSDASVGIAGGGGLAYGNSGRLTNSYARGAVVAESTRGGTLAGYNSGEISCCYATGSVIGKAGSAYFEIASRESNGSITDCYYRVPSGRSMSYGAFGTALSDAQMRRGRSFANWDFWGGQADGSEDVWFMPRDGYPLLTWQYGAAGLSTMATVLSLDVDEAVSQLQSAGIAVTVRYEYDDEVPTSRVIGIQMSGAPEQAVVEVIASLGPYDWSDNPGDGSEGNPFAISLASQVFSLAQHPELWDRHFVLTADLDFGWLTFERALIAADANATQADFQGPRFNGTFDGAGHTLANLTIYSSESYLGFFGALGPAARIAHLHLDNVYIAGTGASQYVGPIAGTSAGTLEDCHTSGYIRGGYLPGWGVGLVGESTGTIKESTSAIDIAPISTPSSRSRTS